VGVRGQVPPSRMGSLYRNTEKVTAIYNSKIMANVTRIHYAPSPEALNFTARLLLRCRISLVPSPMAHSFIPGILLRCLISLSAFSYGA
jgi:hypothetical protein